MRTTAKISIGLLFVAFAVIMVGTPACGSDDCVTQCNRGKECGTGKGLDCDKFCSDVETTVGNADCSSQFDDTVNCETGLTDICKDIGQCSAQTRSLGVCLIKYCADHQAEAGCQDLIQGG